MDKCGTANNVYVGARYVPLIVGEWDPNKTYEPLTVVLYQGTSYTSRTYVPKGIIPSESTAQYWALTGNYNAQVEMYRQEVIKYTNDVNLLIKYVTRTYSDTLSLLNDTTIELDNFYESLGYRYAGDGGHCFFRTTNTQPQGYYFEKNNIFFELITTEPEFNIDMIGCQYDDDISIKINQLINLNYTSLKFNQKNYNLSNQIILNKVGIKIDFNKATINYDGDTNCLYIDGSKLPAYRTNITLANGVFNGTKLSNGISLNVCANLLVKNCIFNNFNHCIHNVNSLINTYENCTFSGSNVAIYQDKSTQSNINDTVFNTCHMWGNKQVVSTEPTQYFGNLVVFDKCEIEGNSNNENLPIIDFGVSGTSTSIQASFNNCWLEENYPYFIKLASEFIPTIFRDCRIVNTANKATNFAIGTKAYLVMINSNDATTYSDTRFKFDDTSKVFTNLSTYNASNLPYMYDIMTASGQTNRLTNLFNVNIKQYGGTTSSNIKMTSNYLDFTDNDNVGVRFNGSWEQPLMLNGMMFIWTFNNKLYIKTYNRPTAGDDGSEIALVPKT